MYNKINLQHSFRYTQYNKMKKKKFLKIYACRIGNFYYQDWKEFALHK